MKQNELNQDEFLDKEFVKSTKLKDRRKKIANVKEDSVKWYRIVQIALLVMATLLLIRQDFIYSLVLGVGVAVTCAEIVYRLVFRK